MDFLTVIYSRHLDSAFTERILGLPGENYKGYVEADATQRARHIPSYSYFLLHGLADSSAPYIHGIQLARSLTDSGILFRYQVSFSVDTVKVKHIRSPHFLQKLSKFLVLTRKF